MSEPATLPLREFHRDLGANFTVVGSVEVVADYGDRLAEYQALRESVGVLDLSFRSRVCLTGADRMRFLHGQVTNDVKKLRGGGGCYSALTTAKGKMQSDLNIFCLQEELLLDFEPGLTAQVVERLGKYIVADDVQVVDVAPYYGLLSVQGPQAAAVVSAVGLFAPIPQAPLSSVKISESALGEIYLMNHARLASSGFDLFVPQAALGVVADQLIAAAKSSGGACGWDAFEVARVAAGIPRFGVDMDESHIASECGIEAAAISYTKGCYIGQEVLNRIHSIGHVNRELRALWFVAGVEPMPARGDKLYHGDKEVGHITSAVRLPETNQISALGYVRREVNSPGTRLRWRNDAAESEVLIVARQRAPV